MRYGPRVFAEDTSEDEASLFYHHDRVLDWWASIFEMDDDGWPVDGCSPGNAVVLSLVDRLSEDVIVAAIKRTAVRFRGRPSRTAVLYFYGLCGETAVDKEGS